MDGWMYGEDWMVLCWGAWRRAGCCAVLCCAFDAGSFCKGWMVGVVSDGGGGANKQDGLGEMGNRTGG